MPSIAASDSIIGVEGDSCARIADILGPEGYGEEHWVEGDRTLDYTIRFENDPEFAPAPDQIVTVTQTLDTDLDPQEGLAVISRVNGETRQSGSTADLVFGVGEIVSFVSSIMTLLPGDIFYNGTYGPDSPPDWDGRPMS